MNKLRQENHASTGHVQYKDFSSNWKDTISNSLQIATLLNHNVSLRPSTVKKLVYVLCS